MRVPSRNAGDVTAGTKQAWLLCNGFCTGRALFGRAAAGFSKFNSVSTRELTTKKSRRIHKGLFVFQRMCNTEQFSNCCCDTSTHASGEVDLGRQETGRHDG